MAKHVDRVVGPPEHLANVDVPLHGTLATVGLVASWYLPKLFPKTASARSIAKTHLVWEDFVAWLIEEASSLMPAKSQTERFTPSTVQQCAVSKKRHKTEDCILN